MIIPDRFINICDVQLQSAVSEYKNRGLNVRNEIKEQMIKFGLYSSHYNETHETEANNFTQTKSSHCTVYM